MSPGRSMEARLAVLVGGAVLFVYLASAGGRIVASDEHTMFLLTQSLVEHHTVAVPVGNGEVGPDGRLYPKAGLGQALAAVPFYVAGKLAAPFFPERLRPFVVRAVTSLVNPVAGALLAAVFLLLLLELGLAGREAVMLTAVLALGTPIWVYAKLFLGETLLALGLTLELYGVVRLRRAGGAGASALAALGAGFAVLVKYAILPAALALFVPALPEIRRARPWIAAMVVLAVFALLGGFYNVARTGDVLGTGYGRQATPAAFTTPLYVGVYGLLLSSGKGLLWFAPIVLLVPAGLAAWRRSDRWSAWAVTAAAVLTVLLYASFEHWAGDGSWGPRYLVPLVPALVAAVGVCLADRASGDRRPWWAGAVLLGALGVAVQIGGVAIYFGSQMREAGDYPYTRAISDPRFMSESHWNPNFSPIVGHWRMLARNLDEHVHGHVPRVSLSGEGAASRLGVPDAQAEQLTHGFDLWPAYAVYAGLPAPFVLAVWGGLWLLALVYASWAWRWASAMELRPRRAPSATPQEPHDEAPADARPSWSMTEPR